VQRYFKAGEVIRSNILVEEKLQELDVMSKKLWKISWFEKCGYAVYNLIS
jgi:hypothetical protein